MIDAHTDKKEWGSQSLSALEPQTPAEERASLNYQIARRRWVFRTTILLALTAVALCFLVTWRHDQMIINSRLQTLGKPVAQLQAQVNQLGWLPAQAPEMGNETFTFYASDSDRHYIYQTSEPVIVAVTAPVQLVLLADGRAVIVYHNKKLEAKWIPIGRFEKAWDRQQKQIEEFERQRKAQPIVIP